MRRYYFVIVIYLTPKQEIFCELVLDETTSILGAHVENQFKFRKPSRRWQRYSNYNLLSLSSSVCIRGLLTVLNYRVMELK